MSTPDNGKNIISSLNPTLLYLQYLLHNARFAVVAQDGTGNYTTIQAAVAAGEKTIFVKEGTYSITSDLVLSGQSLISLAPGKAILSMTDATIELETHTATTAYKFGTCTLTNNSTTVTGVGGTLWDTGANCPSTYTNPWLIGQGMALKVASIQNDTSLLLEDQYRGTTQTINYFLIDAKNINSEISGFTIIHEPTAPRPCIKVSGIGCRVKNNVLRCDRVNTSYAIYGGASAISVVHSAEISGNTINSGLYAVCLKNAHSCNVTKNVVQNQTTHIFSTNTDDGDCFSNSFTFNSSHASSAIAFYLDTGSHYTTISHNSITNCRNKGIYMLASHYCKFDNNNLDCLDLVLESSAAANNYLIFSHNYCNESVEFWGSYSKFSNNVFASPANLDYVTLEGNYITFSSNQSCSVLITGDYATVNSNTSWEGNTYSIAVVGTYCTVVGNAIYRGVDYSIRLAGSGYHTCSGNTIYNSNGSGIGIGSPYCTVSGNVIRTTGAAGEAGITVTASGNSSTIVGNVISGSAVHGIYCIASYCTINGNNCGGSTAAAGIYIETGDQCVINGNVCNSNTTYGIFIANTSDRIIITDNICLNNGTAQIQNNGTNTVQADNIVA